MELVGEQKRIQALFSELRLADEQTVPRFAAVWNRAEARTVRPARAFNLSFVAATALLICVLVSLALWSKYSQGNAPQSAAAGTGIATPAVRPVQVVGNAEANPPVSGEKQLRTHSKSRAKRLSSTETCGDAGGQPESSARREGNFELAIADLRAPKVTER